MIDITEQGRQLAAELASAEGSGGCWDKEDFSGLSPDVLWVDGVLNAFARLATQSLADKAALAESQASYDAAKADLAKIDQLQRSVQNDDGERQLRDVMAEISKLVADYRVETDPLVEAMIDSGLKQLAEIFERGSQSVAKLAEIIDARIAKVQP